MTREQSPAQSRLPATPRKRRSPVERAIVWGVIVLLGSRAGYELWGGRGYRRTISAWNAAMDSAHESERPEKFLLSKARALVTGTPSSSPIVQQGQWYVTTYRWGSLLRKYEATLKCLPGDDPAVILIETSDSGEYSAPRRAPAAPHPGAAERQQAGASEEPLRAPAASSGFVIGAWDKNGDGRIDAEEAPGPVRANFDTLDVNADGFLDSHEIAAPRPPEDRETGAPISESSTGSPPE